MTDPLSFLSAESRAALEQWVEHLVDERLALRCAAAQHDTPGWLTLAHAAERSGYSEKTLRRAIAAGELEAAKVRGRWRVAAAELDAWLAPERPLPGRAPAVQSSPRRPPAAKVAFRALASDDRRDGRRRR